MKSVFNRYLCLGLALWPGFILTHGAGNEGEIFKQVVYSQSSASGAVLAMPTPFGFRATVRNSVTNQTQSLTIPISSVWTPLSFSLTDLLGGHFVFEQRFADLATLETKFAPGPYRWNWYRPHTTPTTIDQTIDLNSPDAYPQSYPNIIGSCWKSGFLRTEPASFELSWNQWINPPAGTEIAFELWTQGGSGGSSTSATSKGFVWGSPLSANKVYDAWLSFRTIQQSTSVTDINAPSNQELGFKTGYARTLYFQISTLPLANEPPTSPDVWVIDGKPVLVWATSQGYTYQLQSSNDLTAWQNVGASTSGTGYPRRFVETNQSTVPKFYRLSVIVPASNSLVILSASYGANGAFADVKSYVQSRIVNGAVNMLVSNSNLGGDPLPGVTKFLTVSYQVGTGSSQQKTVREGLSLSLP